MIVTSYSFVRSFFDFVNSSGNHKKGGEQVEYQGSDS